MQTDITTRSQYNASTWITTTDKVFLLSEADLYGTLDNVTTTNAKDYTYGNSVLVPNVNVRAFTNGSFCWLRSPRTNTSRVSRVAPDGGLSTVNCSVTQTWGVRPALWMDLS